MDYVASGCLSFSQTGGIRAKRPGLVGSGATHNILAGDSAIWVRQHPARLQVGATTNATLARFIFRSQELFLHFPNSNTPGRGIRA